MPPLGTPLKRTQRPLGLHSVQDCSLGPVRKFLESAVDSGRSRIVSRACPYGLPPAVLRGMKSFVVGHGGQAPAPADEFTGHRRSALGPPISPKALPLMTPQNAPTGDRARLPLLLSSEYTFSMN